MKTNWKPYLYVKQKVAAADADFEEAVSYGRLKLGSEYIFWELGFRWYAVPIARVQRAYRRVEETLMQVGCRPGVKGIQKLMLCLDDGTVLALQPGEGDREDVAAAMYEALQRAHPEIQYGKD